MRDRSGLPRLVNVKIWSPMENPLQLFMVDTIKWGSLIKDEEKIRDAKEIERMYSDLVSLLSQGFKFIMPNFLHNYIRKVIRLRFQTH